MDPLRTYCNLSKKFTLIFLFHFPLEIFSLLFLGTKQPKPIFLGSRRLEPMHNSHKTDYEWVVDGGQHPSCCKINDEKEIQKRKTRGRNFI